MKAKFFPSAGELHAWLAAHHADRDELVVGFYKKGSRKQGVTYLEALEEALCFGWIDGVRRSLDADRYEIRFTPRKKGSIWSKVNVGHVERLAKAGRMQPPGVAAFEARTAKRTGIYSFEQSRPTELDTARSARLRANAAASTYFDAQPPSYRRTVAFWVMSAKKEETRDRRLEVLIRSSAKGEVVPPMAFGRNAKKKR